MGWALANRQVLRGRLLLAGHRMDDLSLGEAMDAAYVLMADGGVLADRSNLDRALEEATPDRETWGLSATAEAGQRAMMEAAPPIGKA